MLQMTTKKLEEILVNERKIAQDNGIFGINACKESIEWKMKTFNKSLDEIYVDLVIRALTENGFNTTMLVACELMLLG